MVPCWYADYAAPQDQILPIAGSMTHFLGKATICATKPCYHICMSIHRHAHVSCTCLPHLAAFKFPFHLPLAALWLVLKCPLTASLKTWASPHLARGRTLCRAQSKCIVMQSVTDFDTEDTLWLSRSTSFCDCYCYSHNSAMCICVPSPSPTRIVACCFLMGKSRSSGKLQTDISLQKTVGQTACIARSIDCLGATTFACNFLKHRIQPCVACLLL